MTDISLQQTQTGFDLQRLDGDLILGDELQTSVIWSLFSNAVADDADILPAGVTDRQGWCLDYMQPQSLGPFGSRLWLLRHAKSHEDARQLAEAASQEALQHLVNDGAAKEVNATATLQNYQGGSTGSKEVLQLQIDITEPSGERWQYLWNLSLQAAA